ncbi:uncharacterized protein LOC130996745 [Salvia miltiorrhiza]|uniref:uncharacterized protein LOC130996745 n=1 Tax=Salvia miltiorrhiza TaxID=226208 RepID=UPI0025AC4E68|nr:uncharacterized protein LOC130996745 [Salvia miltiorrhiza]
MDFSKINSQNYYFYNIGRWSEDLDTELLTHFVSMKSECHIVPPHKSPHAKLCVVNSINQNNYPPISLADVDDRLAFLEKRYKTFNKINQRSDTNWDTGRKVVSAAEPVWKKILKDDPSAKWYFYEDEPQFRLMSKLFGLESMKTEHNHPRNIILNSDTPSPNIAGRTVVIVDDSSDDEITSTRSVKKPPPVRRLFPKDDGETPDDQISSTNWSSHEQQILAPARVRKEYPNNGVEGSSCGSSWSPWR